MLAIFRNKCYIQIVFYSSTYHALFPEYLIVYVVCYIIATFPIICGNRLPYYNKGAYLWNIKNFYQQYKKKSNNS